MYLVLTFLPFISFSCAGIFGRYIGSSGSKYITVSCLFFSFLLSLMLFYEVFIMGSPSHIKLSVWINSELFNVNWGFLFDSLTVIMCCVVTFISFIVHLYSTEYMSHDPHISRFMSYLSLFTFGMLLLVTADNYIQLFVGWEGVGLCSYLLINFWFSRIQANKAAIKAMVINRIGDFGLALGIFFIYIVFKALDYNTVFALVSLFVLEKYTILNIEYISLNLIGALLFIGAIGKSAQLGLHTWLPDAMEGPTPVSALIHAATMVTAGVFLVARNSILYEHTPIILNLIAFLGALTAFFAATIGLVQNDIKRIIAYSTCSQLGYMIFACGLSNYSLGIFHLVNHAFFKALLFLGAGSIIHAVNDEQDLRKLGGLKKFIPFTYSIMVTGSLALTGFPFLTGFYSKDAILEFAIGQYSDIGHFSYYLGTFGACFTAFYSTRLLYLTFLTNPNGYKSVILNAKDSSYAITISLFLLSIPSIIFGYFLKDAFIGVGSTSWGNSITVLPYHLNVIDAEFVSHLYKLLPLIVSSIGILSAFIFYFYLQKNMFKIKLTTFGNLIYNFLNKKWFFDKIYNEYVNQIFFKKSFNISYKLIDKGIIEILGPKGISILVFKKSILFSILQSNQIYHYILLFFVGFTAVILLNNIVYMLIIHYPIILIIIISYLYYFYK